MKIKISQIIDIDVPENLSGHTQFKDNLDFVIESIDDDDNHPLVDEMVGN